METYIGRVLGDYRIAEEIGAGGMGKVFLAENVHHKKRCALKVLPEALSRDLDFRARFFDEARVMSDLSHANIVRVHHTGEDGGVYYLVMDYVCSPDGRSRSIHDELAESPTGRIAPAKARRWIGQVAEALAYAHDRGVIHRDIKPANVLIDREGNARITDFGLVKAIGKEFLFSQIHKTIQQTSASQAWKPRADMSQKPGLHLPGVLHTFELAQTARGDVSGGFPGERSPSGTSGGGSGSRSLFGTYDYMSPELMEGKEATPQSDIYSLGVMTYRMLTGRRPVGLAKPPSTVVRGLSKRWDVITARCLADSTADRYSGIEEMLADLAKVEKRSRMRAIIPAVLVLAVAVSSFTWWISRRPIGLNQNLWWDWCDAIAWIRPLQPPDLEQRESWRTDSQLAAVLAEIETCCAVFGTCPELERAYRENQGSDPVQLKRAMAACEENVAGNREAVLAVKNARGAPARIESVFFDPTADTYWSRLATLRQRRDALRTAGCDELCEFLTSLVERFGRRESVPPAELVQNVIRVLYLDEQWPAVEYANLNRETTAKDPRLDGPVEDDSDFMSRLVVLQEHCELGDNESRAISREIEDVKVLGRKVREAIEAAVAHGMEDDADRRQKMRDLESAITELDIPLTVGNRARIRELCPTVRENALGLDPEPWYAATLERAIDGCYGLDENLLWLGAGRDVTMRRLYASWRAASLSRESQASSQVAARVEAIEGIERMLQPADLMARMNEQNARTETVWAAWRQLGSLPNWPGTPEDWEKERHVQTILEGGLAALDESRTESLSQEIADANRVRETVFRKAMIHRHLAAIRDEARGDLFLAKLLNQDMSGVGDTTQARNWEAAMRELTGFLRGPAWRSGDTQGFYADGGKGRTLLDRETIKPRDIDDWRRAVVADVAHDDRPTARATHSPNSLDAEVAVDIPGSAVKLNLRLVEPRYRWFRMGVPASKNRRPTDPSEHPEQLPLEFFYIGKYETTQAQYQAVMGRNPSISRHDLRPVENVSWTDANDFCRRLSEVTNRRFRLPTEVEWEFACRAQPSKDVEGDTWLEEYREYAGPSGLLTDVGWCADAHGYPLTNRSPRPVGSLRPNGWGLYDMHGNVWEWCGNEYADASGSKPGSRGRPVRGGAYDSKPEECRSAWREGRNPDLPAANIGFRVVMDVE